MSKSDKKRQEKLDKIKKITDAVNSKYGEDSVNYLGNKAIKSIPKFSSQCPELDIALGGGWPIGRIIEIYGPPASGKSTATLHAISEFQRTRPDDFVALVDVEFCLKEGSLIFDANDMVYRPVEELFKEKQEFIVLSLSNNGDFIKQKAIVKKSNIRQTYKIECEYGKILNLTDNHKVLTQNGYKEVKQLNIGDIVYTPKVIPFKIEKNNKLLDEKKIEQNNLIEIEIIDIIEGDIAQTYDVSVANENFDEQNFLADGVIIHNSFDPIYAKRLGVNVGELIVSQPSNGNEALNVMMELIRQGVKLIIVDSVAALLPKQEDEEEDLGKDVAMGAQARMMSKMLRKLTGVAGKSDTTVIFTNQERDKIGITWGEKKTQPGGWALKFQASVRVQITRIGSDKKGDEVILNRVKAKVTKNKCIHENEVLFLPEEGRCYTIKELSGRKNFSVLSFNGNKIVNSSSEGCYPQERKQGIKIKTRGIGSIVVSTDHPFLTPDGYIDADKLTIGTLIATAMKIPFNFKKEIDKKWDIKSSRLVGLLLGDGFVKGTANISLINELDSVINEFKKCCSEFNCEIYQSTNLIEWKVRTKNGGHKGKPSRLNKFLKRIGLFGCTVKDKEIPSEIFFIDKKKRWELIGGYLATDGYVSISDRARIGFTTTTLKLAEGLRYLLLTLGISPSIRETNPRQGGIICNRRIQGKRNGYEIRISNIDDIKLMKKSIKFSGGKLDKLNLKTSKTSKTKRIPAKYAKRLINIIKDKKIKIKDCIDKLEWGKYLKRSRNWNRALGIKNNSASQQRVLELSKLFNVEEIINLCSLDINWRKIIKIEDVGNISVLDISNTGWNNFVINGMVTHNCAPPFRTAEFIIRFGKGISRLDSILDCAIDFGLIKKAGAWFSYEKDGTRLGQGRENTLDFLKRSPEIVKELEEKVKAMLARKQEEYDIDDMSPEELEVETVKQSIGLTGTKEVIDKFLPEESVEVESVEVESVRDKLKKKRGRPKKPQLNEEMPQLGETITDEV